MNRLSRAVLLFNQARQAGKLRGNMLQIIPVFQRLQLELGIPAAAACVGTRRCRQDLGKTKHLNKSGFKRRLKVKIKSFGQAQAAEQVAVGPVIKEGYIPVLSST